MANTATDLYLKKLRQKYKEKGATELEANSMASQDTAQQEAQKIQNGENLNGWQKFGAGVEEFVDGMAQTFLDLGEGLVDSIAIAAGSIAEGVGDTTSAKNIRGFVERDWTDELVNQGNAFGTGVDLWRWANFPSEALWGNEARDYSRQNDLLPDVVDSISSGIGSSLGMGALSSIPYVGWVLTGMAAGGASAEQELRNNPDTDISSAMGYGILNGMTEVASELLVGKVLGWIGKGINSAMGKSVVSETATRFGLGSSTGGNILTNLLKEFNEEGIEEVVSEFVDPIARKLTIEKDKPIGDALGETWGNAEWWINDVWTAYWQGGLSSVVMGGAGATANTIKAGGIKNYNAILQVKQVAEINEQIKELESKNTNGMYDSKIEALTAQKENVINNFQKNFEQFVNDYLKSQTEETLSKKEIRRASIGEEMNYEQNRNLRQELAKETALESGALHVSFDKEGKPSYAVKKDNFINYDGKKLSTKEWIKEVIHEIGHINVKDFSFVDSILQDVSAQDLQNAENEYNKRYKEAYTNTEVKKTDYYKEELENTKDEAKALENARKKMIREEIAMDRFASYFDNIGEFKRAISGEKVSLIERLKERFMNTYKHVEKAQKPKNYDSIIKALREAVEDTKQHTENLRNGTEQFSEEEDIRYESDENNVASTNEVKTVRPATKSLYIKKATALLKTIDESKVEQLNSIIEKMNNTNDYNEFEALTKEYTNLLEEQKENTNEQNLQRPNETGTGTVRQGVPGDIKSISESQSRSTDTKRTDIQNEQVGKEVGIEPGTSDRLYRGSRAWDGISNAKNEYNSKLRRTSNKGRGRDRILNLYRYGEFIRENINIATTPTNINGQTYSVIKDEALPEFLLDMRNEFKKVSTAKGLDIYFFVSDANDTRNGFAVGDNIITIRLDSSATNTAIHELSHILSKMDSNSYNKAFDSLFNDYFVKNKKEYDELYEPIRKTYEAKYKPRFIKEYGVTKYEDLSQNQKTNVDIKTRDLLDEELFCAIIQGKTKIQDRSFYNKVLNNYLADIKTEYGADLAQYYYNGFINADEVEVKPEDIKMSKYTPVEIINPTPTNKKIGLETYSQYLERMNKLVTSFRNKVDTLESMTDFNKILPNYEILKDYRLNLKRTFRDLKNYKIEWENAYKADFEILAAKYEEVKNLFVEYSDKFEARKDENGNKIPSLLDTLSAKVDKLTIIDQYQKEKKELLNYLSRDRFKGSKTYSNKAQNLAETIEIRYNTAIENTINSYDSKIYEQIKKAIDILWNDFASETERISELLNKGELAENKEKQTEKKIKKKLNRGELTYSVEDEAKRLKELKETLKPNLKEVQDVVHTYSKLIKSAKSKYLKYNLDPSTIDETHRPLGKKAKISLHEKLVKYINDLTTKIADYRKLAEEYTKDETFRKTNLYREIYETITTLENKIGTTLDGDPEETLYGLKNTLYVDIVKYNNSSEKYAEIVSKQSASTKKEIKDTIKDIERNIPNEANDLIDNLEEQIEKYKELASKYEEQSEKLDEINKYVSELEAKLKKAKTQLGNAMKKAPKRVELWKNKYANAMATIKDLKDELKRYKKEILENDSPDKVNLKEETSDYAKKYSALEKELNEQKQINEKVQKELKEKKAEFSKKVTENKALAKKIDTLRKKLVWEKVNGKSIVKMDTNFYRFLNEMIMSKFQQDINLDEKSFSDEALKRFVLAFANNDSAEFAQTLVEELEAKGYDKELLALENGEHLYYESNFTDLVELAFEELNNFQNSELTNVGKLMVRLENAKTDYKLLQQAYGTNMRIRTATTSVKSFTKFFNENTKATSSRLHGVDKGYREALVNFVRELQENQSITDVENGTVRRKIIDFFNELKTAYKAELENTKSIEVNGIALDSGILNMVKVLEQSENDYKEYIKDLANTSEIEMENAKTEKEVKKATPKDTYKISEDEAKIYRSLFKGLRKFTDDVMHNRIWEVGNATMTGTEFTHSVVKDVQELKSVIRHLKWNPFSKMYVSPRNIFREISGYKENSLVMEFFNELEKGTIRTMQAKMELAKPLREFFDKHKKFEKELQKDSEKYRHTIKYGNKTVTASTTMLLDLYEAMQNENNRKHLMNDGFELGNAKPIAFANDELSQLEKAIVKEFNLDSKDSIYSQYIKLLNDMYELAKKYKIETDIRTRGFTNVDEGFYYPTNVSDYNIDIDLSKGAYNMGNSYGGVDLVTNQRSFNMDRTSTRGAIRIVNSYEKMLQHINGMASYYGVDTSILNFSKMFRYRVEGGISSGNAIRQLYGTEYGHFTKYLGELFKDMRGTNTPTTGSDALFKKIEHIVRGGVVTATLVNPKVIATQPASLLTAFKYVSPKHILSSLKEGFTLTSKYPPLPTIGAYRYFDQSALQAETGGVSGIQKTIGKGISAGDHFAINIEWAACCKQVGLLELKQGTAEYEEALKKATDLFTRVVNDTQPNNTPIGKAEIMRSDNEIVKLLTMYRSQAMQNFNIAYDAINQLRMLKQIAKARRLSYKETKILLARPKKELERALASLILEGALFTFIGQLFSHFVNNDWDEEDFWLHATNDFGLAYFNDNILGIMPVLNKLELEYGDRISISMDNITMGWLENVIDSIQKLSEGGSPKQFIQVISYGTGIPLATNYKYTKAIIQYFAPEFAYEFDAVYNGANTRSKSAINYALNDNQSAKAYELYKKYTSYSMEFDMSTTKELFNLYKDGYTDTAVKQIPSTVSYNGNTYTIDKTKFKDIYSNVAKRINNLTKASAYKNMTKYERAETIKYLLDMYYSIAKKNFTGQELSFVEKILFYDMNLTTDKILMIKSIKDIESDEKLSKKEKTQLYINKLQTNKAYKYFLYMTSGYSLNDEQKKYVKSYLINNGLSWKKATEVLQ